MRRGPERMHQTCDSHSERFDARTIGIGRLHVRHYRPAAPADVFQSGSTDVAAVLKAVQEFDALGRETFPTRYGLGEVRQYFLALASKRYDSKAAMGAARGYQFPEKGPLRAADFSGGDATVKAKLQQRGFTVESMSAGKPPMSQPRYASSSLQAGAV